MGWFQTFILSCHLMLYPPSLHGMTIATLDTYQMKRTYMSSARLDDSLSNKKAFSVEKGHYKSQNNDGQTE